MFMSFVKVEGVMVLVKCDLFKFIKFGEFYFFLFFGSLKLKDLLMFGFFDV